MKAHIGVDAESGLVHTVVSTAANVNEMTQAGALLHGEEEVAFGDAGYQSMGKRTEAQGPEWFVAMRPGKRRQLDKHKKPQTVGSAEMLRSAAAPAAYTGQGKPGQWAPTSTLVSVWPVQPVVPGTQGCGSAFISCESGSSFFFYTDSDAGPFSMRKRIQLEKLCQKIPCEKFAVVKNSAGHLRHS